jgi:hypothetical protein
VFGHFIVYWCSTIILLIVLIALVLSLGIRCSAVKQSWTETAFKYQEMCPVIKNAVSNLIILDKLH